MLDSFISNICSLYGLRAANNFVSLYEKAGYNPFRYLTAFWSIQNFAEVQRRPLKLGGSLLRDVTTIGMLFQLIVGIWLCIQGAALTDPPLTIFGLAAIVSYPLVWAHLLIILSVLGLVFRVKSLGKWVLCGLLERQVKALRRRHQFSVVVVAGSVGKTSTKLAIADVLSSARRVQYQSGNYNVRLTVPLIFFGHNEPSIYNVVAWLKILLANQHMIKQDYPYDVVVVELGTNSPGPLAKFAYLQPELGVLTAIAPEHMENFETVDDVAKEETTIFDYCQRVLVNTDDVDAKYLEGREYVSYGSDNATYRLKSTKPGKKLSTQRVTFDLAGHKVSETINHTGKQGAKVALAAAAVASELALSDSDVKAALKHLRAFAGRMQILSGIKKSTIIDDSYNASPAAVKAALDVMYDTEAPQRIALLGNMNEMGDYAKQAHRDIGTYCDPAQLDLVVTLGRDANNYLAEAAQQRGCNVQTCTTPYEAGKLIASELKEGALVLIKGSQNGVFAEEAIKDLLVNKEDESKLVRQSAHWNSIKRRQFGAPKPS